MKVDELIWSAVKSYRIPWYIKFLLNFKRSYYGTDVGVLDDTIIVEAKYLFGKIYIINVELK